MKFIEQIERCERILYLIKRKATGTPQEFAVRLQISQSTLYDCIKILKLRGAQIEYCACRQSYILQNDFNITFGCSNLELKQIKGGYSLIDLLRKNRSGSFYNCSTFRLNWPVKNVPEAEKGQ